MQFLSINYVHTVLETFICIVSFNPPVIALFRNGPHVSPLCVALLISKMEPTCPPLESGLALGQL